MVRAPDDDLQIGWHLVKKIADAETTNGAPQSMKMGTIASPWRYDAGACGALRSSNLGQLAISRYARPE
jgi:hypothetical protein